jgi:hypothetical protein
MALRKLQILLASCWLAVLLVGVATAVSLGVTVPPATQMLILVAAVVPPYLALTLFRGPSPRSVTQILYDQEQPPTSRGQR